MSKKRSVAEDLKNVLETMEKIDRFVEGMDYEDFLEDEKTMFAVAKAIEIIGETLKHVPEETKENYADVPWEDIYGMRNFLAHNYFGSDQDEIWKTVKEDIPELKLIISKIMEEESENRP
ncbi:MAG: DUF86 domain-containing protein [bacterium]|nr:DUF86 domain-containing protein [bacterium]